MRNKSKNLYLIPYDTACVYNVQPFVEMGDCERLFNEKTVKRFYGELMIAEYIMGGEVFYTYL